MPIHYGWAETTPALRHILAGGVRSVARRVKRRAKKAVAKRAKKAIRSKSRSLGKMAKFVKGSQAAKRHMAKLRKLAAKARRG